MKKNIQRSIFLLIFLISGSDVFSQERTIIQIKFERNFADKQLKLRENFKNPDKKSVTTHIAELDELAKTYSIYEIRPVFATNPKYAERHKKFDLDLFYEISYNSSESLEIILKDLESKSFIRIAEKTPLAIIESSGSDDQYENMQWGLYNSNYRNFDINVRDAWAITTGDTNVITAIIDGCVDNYHPDLEKNMWINRGEIPNNRTDDDGNGFVDDVYGWNFVDNDPYIRPVVGNDNHGTHVAGIVGASTNNFIGVAGVAGGWGQEKGVRLMGFRAGYVAEDGNGYISHGYPAMVYAADNGAAIAQCSWGGGNISAAGDSAVRYFQTYGGGDVMNGGLIIASAGNDNSMMEKYPAAYDGVLSVGSIQSDGSRSSFSNYGFWVKISAPGTQIYSTLPFETYGYMSGTSMSCPMVSGVAALVLSAANKQAHTVTPNWLYDVLVNTAKPLSTDRAIGPLVDATAAVNYAISSTTQNRISDLTYDIAPNPADKTIFIEGEINNMVSIEILDLQGHTMYRKKGRINSINVSEFIQGIYILKIESDKGITYKKFIKL